MLSLRFLYVSPAPAGMIPNVKIFMAGNTGEPRTRGDDPFYAQEIRKFNQ